MYYSEKRLKMLNRRLIKYDENIKDIQFNIGRLLLEIQLEENKLNKRRKQIINDQDDENLKAMLKYDKERDKTGSKQWTTDN